MSLDKELLEVALRTHGTNYTVQRIISMESELALPKGENYLSVIYRVTLKVVLGNGRTANRSLILKVIPPEKAKTELVQNMGVFKSETMMYTIVLREMEYLMEEFGDTNDVLWCKLVHHEPYTSLLLEDLKASGFRMTRRQDCLDLEHSLLVLRSLGRFHAMSKILEQRGIITKDDYKPYALVSDKNLIKFFMYYGLQTLAKAMEENWGPEWYDVAQKLKIPCEVLQEKMIKLGEVDETRFNCLNHGDCWSNNMMFKYDWQNRPYTMRFVDYQLSFYNTPCLDLTYAMYTTMDPEIRRRHYHQFLETYFNSLTSTLEYYNYPGQRPTFQEIKEGVDRMAFLRVGINTLFAAIMMTESDTGVDMDLVLRTAGEQGHNMSIYNEDKFKKKIGPDILELIDIGVL